MLPYRFCHFACLLMGLIFLLLTACQSRFRPARDFLAEKAGPYDLFAQQRAYPDSIFDWDAWRQALREARQQEAVVTARSGCKGSNPTAWTLQGPANVAGRVNCLAVKPDNEDVVLAGFASGGIFKSSDGGSNWKPVFEDDLELSIGDISFDPQNPNVVYAGTGDVNMPSQLFNGHGLYKSTDAGETWQYLGLGEQGIISHVVVHPANSQILYAAVNGNPFVRNDKRGVYKSTNGGQSWQRIHFVSEQAGASDLVMNPQQPDVLYASYWDRIRSNTESTVYGPNSKVYKTTDGGTTWTQLSGGLPTGKMGRSGLAISRQNPNKVYAVFVDTLSRPGGLYRSIDGGQTWIAMNIGGLADTYGGFGWYFGKIEVHPDNDEELYFHGILLWRKAAGSSGWSVASGGHADSHDLIWTSSGRRYWANDGGVYRNNSGSSSWTRCNNLPTTQFYHTDYNPHLPGTYFCGAQDNGIQKGSAANPNGWVSVFSADGFHSAFDPTNPLRYWVETQSGAIHRTTDGGDSWQQGTTCLGTTDRCNWDTPLFLSRHPQHLLYAATYRVYSSPDGTGWAPLSPDLTDGVLTEARFHNISCVAESPLIADKLLAGTSDGNVWWGSPAGLWTNITTGLPDRYVTSVHGSPTLPNRFFVTHSGIKYSEDIPHVHRSDDNGQTWVNISGNLPQVPVNDLFVLPGHADSVLFAGTDAGAYFSLNGGKNWARLGKQLPYVAVFDLEHNLARKQLMAATFGRGLWTFPLDSVFVQGAGNTTTTVGGEIKTEYGAGVAEVVLKATSPPVISSTTGSFVLPQVAACQPYEVEPKLLRAPLNGVSTYDLVLISKHILGLEPLTSPYRIIAADGNRSGSITTYDIVVLRRLILGIDTTIANNTSWRFVPKNFVFPDTANPFKTTFPEKLILDLQTTAVTDADFIGIKIGDLNASAQANAAAPTEDRDGQALLFEVTAQGPVHQGFEVAAGDWVDLEFRPTEALQGYQMTIEMEGLAWGSIPEGAALPDEHFGVFERSGAAAFSVSSEKNVPFRVRLRALRAGHLHDMLQLSDRVTRSEAYRTGATGAAPSPLALYWPTDEEAGFALLPCTPNPMQHTTQVRFRLPESSSATLTFRSADGRLLHRVQGDFPKGLHAVTLSKNDLGGASGVVFYTLEIPGHRASGKVLLQR